MSQRMKEGRRKAERVLQPMAYLFTICSYNMIRLTIKKSQIANICFLNWLVEWLAKYIFKLKEEFKMVFLKDKFWKS